MAVSESINARIERAYRLSLVVQSFARVMDPHDGQQADDTDLCAAAFVLQSLIEPLVDVLDGLAVAHSAAAVEVPS